MQQAPKPPEHEALPARINLGCGQDYRDGWHNVDINEAHDPDQVVDLDERPWPWESNQFAHALMDNVIEHLDDSAAALHELARIVQPGGTVVVRVPHWNSPGARTNPTHTNTLTHRSFDSPPVSHLFEVENIDCTRVRFGRALPKPAALWLADHIGHIVSEVEVRARVVDYTEGEQDV